MYLSDICTIPVNLAGLPAISIPAGLSKSSVAAGAMGLSKSSALAESAGLSKSSVAAGAMGLSKSSVAAESAGLSKLSAGPQSPGIRGEVGRLSKSSLSTESANSHHAHRLSGENPALPVGLHIIANTLREDNVFRVAYTLEKALGFDKYPMHLYE